MDRDEFHGRMRDLVDSLNLLIPSLAGGDEPFRVGRPSERLRLVLVVQIDEVQNRSPAVRQVLYELPRDTSGHR